MKEIDWAPIAGYSVFCDDIRMEINGKQTFVGVYRGILNVYTDKKVDKLPRLCVAVTYTEMAGLDRPSDYELLVFFPGDEQEPKLRASITMPDNGIEPTEAMEGHRMVIKMNIELAPFPAQEGYLRIRMKRGENEIVRLGSLKVNMVPPPQAPALGVTSPNA